MRLIRRCWTRSMPFSRQPNNANKSIISKQHKTDLFMIRICLSEHMLKRTTSILEI